MYIARQPILKANMEVYGYELLYRDSKDSKCFNNISSVKATASVIVNVFESGIENIVGDKMAFINFDHEMFEYGLLDLIDKSRVVIEILENVVIDQTLLINLKTLTKEGYKIALDDVTELDRLYELLDYAHIIKIDISMVKLDEIKPMVDALLRKGKILLAEKVETEEEFVKTKRLGFHLFQGYFFSKPKIIGQKNDNKSALKTQYIKILNEINQVEPSYSKIAVMIEQDVNLTYRFLRVVSCRAKDETIDSIKRALTYIGLRELEKWIHLLLVQDLGGNKPKELMGMSLSRYKFSERLSIQCLMRKQSHEAALMGLLSVIDVLQDTSMEEALKDLPLSINITSALIRSEGELSPIFRIVKAIEIADWVEVEFLSSWLKLSSNVISNIYLGALEWSDETMALISV